MKVRKTTFEEEQREKDEAFLNLSPHERLAQAYAVRKKMRRPGIDYSYVGKRVTIVRKSLDSL